MEQPEESRPRRRLEWTPDAKPPEGQRAALHRLANALRRTMVALMDTNASEEELNAAAEAAERFATRLEEGPRGRAQWGYAESAIAGRSDASFDNSPLLGHGNPIAPPIHTKVVGNTIEARVTFPITYEGPPGCVHGGFVAAAFDEVLGVVQSLGGNPGMTGTLVVRYRRPTPLYTELVIKGRVERIEG